MLLYIPTSTSKCFGGLVYTPTSANSQPEIISDRSIYTLAANLPISTGREITTDDCVHSLCFLCEIFFLGCSPLSPSPPPSLSPYISPHCTIFTPPPPPPFLPRAGNSGVGKTSLILRVSQGQFSPVSSTLGLDFSTKTLTVGDERVVFQLWDTAGQERWVT